MSKRSSTAAGILAGAALVGAVGAGARLGERTPGQTASPVVVLETEKGTIEIEVDVARAPVTSENFLQYVDGGLYDGGVFHRTVRPDTETRTDYPIEVVQARRARGSRGPAEAVGRGRGRGRGGFPPIPIERTRDTGLRHLDGVVSMARSAPDSATNEFFICIGDQPELDFGGRRNADGQGFAAFGRVVAGMDVVRAIQASPVRENSQALDPPITIVRAVRKTVRHPVPDSRAGRR